MNERDQHHRRSDGEKLDELLYLAWVNFYNQEILMALIDDISQDVADESSVIDSAVQLLTNLSAQLAAAGTDPQKLAALKTSIDANKDKLAQAVAQNTPGAPTP